MEDDNAPATDLAKAAVKFRNQLRRLIKELRISNDESNDDLIESYHFHYRGRNYKWKSRSQMLEYTVIKLLGNTVKQDFHNLSREYLTLVAFFSGVVARFNVHFNQYSVIVNYDIEKMKEVILTTEQKELLNRLRVEVNTVNDYSDLEAEVAENNTAIENEYGVGPLVEARPVRSYNLPLLHKSAPQSRGGFRTRKRRKSNRRVPKKRS
jgi:hypothetical protein